MTSYAIEFYVSSYSRLGISESSWQSDQVHVSPAIFRYKTKEHCFDSYTCPEKAI